MRKRKVRLKRKYRLAAWSLFIVILLIIVLIPQSNRKFLTNFFGTGCINHQQVYSRKLNDMIPDYLGTLKTKGIDKCRNEEDLFKKVMEGELTRVRSGFRFIVEDMTHGYPYLTKESRRLVKEIGKRFHNKIAAEGFGGTRFIITSMTRSVESVESLAKYNVNASENSPHLSGLAFDISYARFSVLKLKVQECDKWYLKEALAEVIWELREEKKCWATYERQQGCFHVVAR